ncbi:MAG: hypothetical protein ACTSRZ_17500 [Promethearchaeota archaeon]
METFFKNFQLALEKPENSAEILKNHRILKFFIIFNGFFCWIVWFEAGFDVKRPFFATFVNNAQLELILVGFKPGSFFYSLLVIIFAIVFILLNAIILFIEIRKKSTKREKLSITSILVIDLINIPLILTIASIPMLILNEEPFSSSYNFIPSLIWATGGFLAIISRWIYSGKILMRNFLAFKKGFIIAFVSTILFAIIFYSFFYIFLRRIF